MAKTWVYLMLDHRSGFYKVGRSNQPRFREKTLQAEVPLVDLVEAWWTDPKNEKVIHFAYRSLRLRGEWFRLTDVEVRNIYEFLSDCIRLSTGTSWNAERFVEETINEDEKVAEETEARKEHLKDLDEAHAAWDLEDLALEAAAVDFLAEGFGIEL